MILIIKMEKILDLLMMLDYIIDLMILLNQNDESSDMYGSIHCTDSDNSMDLARDRHFGEPESESDEEADIFDEYNFDYQVCVPIPSLQTAEDQHHYGVMHGVLRSGISEETCFMTIRTLEVKQIQLVSNF
jgi:hypothetical protein